MREESSGVSVVNGARESESGAREWREFGECREREWSERSESEWGERMGKWGERVE